MSGSERDRVRQVARNLIEVLSSYEEELIALERGLPNLAQLRRAVGMVIAGACYCISDEVSGDWVSQVEGPVRRTS